MGIAGAGYGAAKTLEQLVMERRLQQALTAEIENRNRALTEQNRSNVAEEGLRRDALAQRDKESAAAADDRAANRRDRANAQGLRTMAGDFIRQGASTPDDMRGLAALQAESGERIDPDLLIPKPPPPAKKYQVTVPGPNGPMSKLVGEDEMEQGVQTYREPRQPDKPTYIQYTDPEGKLQSATPDEIRAQGGVTTQAKAGGLGTAPLRMRAQRTASALNAVEHLKSIMPQRAPGLPGIVQGVGQRVQGYLGGNTKAREFEALIQPTAMQMAVAIQGAANLSDSERKAMAEQLGNIGSISHPMDYDTQVALLDNALEMLRNNADVQQVTTKDPQTGMPKSHWVARESGPIQDQSVDLPGAEGGAVERRPIPNIPGGIAEKRNGKWIRVQ